MIELADFEAVEMRVGRICSAVLNPKARKPSYVLDIDFGEAVGHKTSSAQLTGLYAPEDLVGRQVVAVVNFGPRRVAGVKSEVLVLAAVCEERGTVLLALERDVALGTRIL